MSAELNVPTTPEDLAYAAAALVCRMSSVTHDVDTMYGVVCAMNVMANNGRWISEMWLHPDDPFHSWVDIVMPELRGLFNIDPFSHRIDVGDGEVSVRIPSLMVEAGQWIANLDLPGVTNLIADSQRKETLQ